MSVNAVLVREEKPPAGEEPVEWLLLTSLPMRTFAQANQVVAYYCCRWAIEVYQPEYPSSEHLYQRAA